MKCNGSFNSKKNRDKIIKSLVIIFFIVATPFTGRAEVITLTDGTKIDDKIVSMEDGKVRLLNSGVIDRSEVSGIVMQTKEETALKQQDADDDEIKAIIARANEFGKKYPDQNGLMLLDAGYYEYKEDGSRVYRYHYRFKVLKEVAKHAANVTSYLNEGRERINILLARTISPDGKVYNLDPTSINISKPAGGARSFSRYETYSFMLPNVEVGSIIEYIMELDGYNPFEKRFFFPQFGFQDDKPVLLSRLTVVIPEDEKLYYVFNNFDSEHEKPKVTKSDGKKSYVWEYKDVEPLVREPYMPSYKDTVPYISCSIFDDWGIFYDWAESFLVKKMVVTDDVSKKVEELTKGSNTVDERIAKLYHYVQRDIRYISIKSSIGSGYSGHAAQETLHNEYGDCIDKAVLFTTMLKALGIKSYPIFLKTNDSNDTERRLPGFDSNHAITKVVLEDRTMFLDTTSENFRYPYFQAVDHGIWVLNPLQRKFEFIPIPPPKDNATISISTASIKENGDFEVDGKASYTGFSESRRRYYINHVKRSDMIRGIKNRLNSLSPGSRLKYYAVINGEDFSKPLNVDTGYILKNYGIVAGDLVILSVPDVQRSFSEVALSKRKYPLEFMSSMQDTNEFTIDLGGEYAVKYLPEPLHFDNEYFSYDMEYKEEAGKIIFIENYQRKKRVVPVSYYEEYRKAHKEIERRLRDKMFLVRLK